MFTQKEYLKLDIFVLTCDKGCVFKTLYFLRTIWRKFVPTHVFYHSMVPGNADGYGLNI